MTQSVDEERDPVEVDRRTWGPDDFEVLPPPDDVSPDTAEA